MAYYKIPDPEQLIQCPYDRCHMKAANRMQYHLIKCRKNFTGRDFGTCPFNARHEMPKPELRYHIASCPDKAMLEHILSYEQSKMSEDGKKFKGCTDLPKYDQPFDSINAENWDEEIPENPRIGVDPSYFARLEYKELSGMRKSEKKKWKQQYTLPPNQRQCPMQETKEEEEEGQLRRPHIMPSKFMPAQCLQQPSQVLSYSLAMAGIGRGGTGLASQPPQGIGRTVGRAENAAGIGRAVGRSQNMPGVGRVLGRGDNIPGVGRAMGRATAMHNYVQSNIVNGGLTNGFTQSNMEDTNGNGMLEKPPGLDDQFGDYELQENSRPVIKKEVAMTPAGIGRGGGAPPTSQFSVGIGRGMLRDLHLNGSPSFVVPIVTHTTAVPPSDSTEPEGSINAVRSIDAKNKERRKIEKKLKQIELLEGYRGKGYKYNDEEKVKLGAKDKLLKALEAL